MRRSILTFLFFIVIGPGAGWCFQTGADEILFVPEHVKDRALKKTLQYGRELYLRQDFDQATRLLKHIIALDPCNQNAREGLKMIADKDYQKDTINAYLAGLACKETPPPQIAETEPEESLIPEPEPSKELHLTSQEYQEAMQTASPQLRDIINYKDKDITSLKERLAQEVSGEVQPLKKPVRMAITAPTPKKTVAPKTVKSAVPVPAKFITLEPTKPVASQPISSVTPQPLKPVLPAPGKTGPPVPITTAPSITGTLATAASPQHRPLQGVTLQEKLADLQKRIQRVEDTAQSQSTRLNNLDNQSPITQN